MQRMTRANPAADEFSVFYCKFGANFRQPPHGTAFALN
jgi:hypothetical protein